jgi:hypothetical protein
MRSLALRLPNLVWKMLKRQQISEICGSRHRYPKQFAFAPVERLYNDVTLSIAQDARAYCLVIQFGRCHSWILNYSYADVKRTKFRTCSVLQGEMSIVGENEGPRAVFALSTTMPPCAKICSSPATKLGLPLTVIKSSPVNFLIFRPIEGRSLLFEPSGT